MDEEEMSEEELEAIKKREKVFDFLWSPEEKRTVLGLLKGKKMKKEMKDRKAKNVGLSNSNPSKV